MEATDNLQEYEGSVYYIKTNFMVGMRWYHIFAFLWITQFVLACQDITIAGAVAQWFFTRNKKKDLGWPILTSMKRMYRYHLGSIALGSLIIAIVKLVRYMLKSLEKRLNRNGNQCCACLLKCCRCCLWCFEKFIKFLNKNAYIEIAIYGYGFCKAAQKAFTLLVSNVLRVAAINSVGTFVLFLIKMSIVGLTVLIGFYMFKDRTDLNYFFVPLIIAAIFSYFIAHCFISVFEMTIDTLFLCFCEDCERNDGIAKPYFMSKGLMKFVENSRKAMEALEEREKIEKNNNNNNNNNGQSWATTVQPVGAGNPNAPPLSPAVRGLTPLQPAYPPTSVPPSPAHYLSPNT
ncbi:hypothetical protein Pmani_009461 [Petrolisthes manimaculis]|uniref:Choline transporter-like protein n=1 Tax=Petrolisthes manimaculis TaxID=1843537 RepID=A0AAE1Q4W3_9EUCA|nr:hypothetical protein Pmani_009461 [Petrolisthes manimaculis]